MIGTTIIITYSSVNRKEKEKHPDKDASLQLIVNLEHSANAFVG